MGHVRLGEFGFCHGRRIGVPPPLPPRGRGFSTERQRADLLLGGHHGNRVGRHCPAFTLARRHRGLHGRQEDLPGRFPGIGVPFTALLFFVEEGDWLLASTLFILAYIGFAGANVFYEALLPSVARGDDVDRVSTAGYALGYIGGGILIAINVIWYLFPDAFGFADGNLVVRVSFVSAAVWWAVF